MDERQLEQANQDVATIIIELAAAAQLNPGAPIVFGVSTSEVMGGHIGTSGSTACATAIYEGVEQARKSLNFEPVFQCCEHLNRALVMERTLLERLGLTQVSAVPVPRAGGSMAAYAYLQMKDPVLAESIIAQAGIDIGQTLIGMHIRHVAVPFRPTIIRIGDALVTSAYTRPKLIGGQRAVYTHPGTCS